MFGKGGVRHMVCRLYPVKECLKSGTFHDLIEILSQNREHFGLPQIYLIETMCLLIMTIGAREIK